MDAIRELPTEALPTDYERMLNEHLIDMGSKYPDYGSSQEGLLKFQKLASMRSKRMGAYVDYLISKGDSEGAKYWSDERNWEIGERNAINLERKNPVLLEMGRRMPVGIGEGMTWRETGSDAFRAASDDMRRIENLDNATSGARLGLRKGKPLEVVE